MKKSIIALAGLVIIVGGLAAGGYFWWRPRVANNYVVKAADAFLAGQDNNDDQADYQKALVLIDKAIAWGKGDSTAYLFRGNTLAKLGRYAEARAQYEAVIASDASAKQAADDLISQLPS